MAAYEERKMRHRVCAPIRVFLFLTVTMVAACGRGGGNEGQGTVPGGASPREPGPPQADLVLSSNRDGDNDIYLLPAGSSDWINLTNHPGGDNWPVWSPDGSRIAFQSDRGGSLDVWVMDADGSNLQQLTTDPEPDYLPVWSPDGSQLSFASWRAEPGDTIRANHIYLMNADGTGQVRLFSESPGTSAEASWAPDGSGWVLSRKTGEEPSDVFLIDDSGAVIGRLTEDGASNGTAAFSPNGTQIAYYADRGDVSELVIAASDGSEPRTLLSQGQNYYPRWSPDGRWIVFTAAVVPGQTNDLDVLAIPVDGSGPPVTLAGGPGREAEGSWRPGGVGSTPLLSRGPSDPTPGPEEGDGRRELRKEITIAAPVEQVWAIWTDPEAMRFVSAESNIELRVGGPYEWFLDLPPDENGRRGGEGCRVLAFLPYRVLAFDWSFPPSVPSLRTSRAKTQVVIRFDEIEAGTRVRFSQIGWEQGEEWDAGYAYFDEAWDYVLRAMKQHLEEGSQPTR